MTECVECYQAGTVDFILYIQDVADDAWHNHEAESKSRHSCWNVQHHSEFKVHTASWRYAASL